MHLLYCLLSWSRSPTEGETRATIYMLRAQGVPENRWPGIAIHNFVTIVFGPHCACSHRNLIFRCALCVVRPASRRAPQQLYIIIYRERPCIVYDGVPKGFERDGLLYVTGRTLEKLLTFPATVNYDFLPFQIAL